MYNWFRDKINYETAKLLRHSDTIINLLYDRLSAVE